MPEFFKLYLQGLTDEQAEIMWSYLDETEAIEEKLDAIAVICDSHPKIVEEDKRKYEAIA